MEFYRHVCSLGAAAGVCDQVADLQRDPTHSERADQHDVEGACRGLGVNHGTLISAKEMIDTADGGWEHGPQRPWHIAPTDGLALERYVDPVIVLGRQVEDGHVQLSGGGAAQESGQVDGSPGCDIDASSDTGADLRHPSVDGGDQCSRIAVDGATAVDELSREQGLKGAVIGEVSSGFGEIHTVGCDKGLRAGIARDQGE
jgi:hypothetical protein